jgi:hypothetical protein
MHTSFVKSQKLRNSLQHSILNTPRYRSPRHARISLDYHLNLLLDYYNFVATNIIAYVKRLVLKIPSSLTAVSGTEGVNENEQGNTYFLFKFYKKGKRPLIS